MTRNPSFDKGLYQGTAPYYDRFRPAYPQQLLADLVMRVPIEPSAKTLDLACGTGQLAFGLAKLAAEVWAVDQEPEFIEFGRRQAQGRGVENIRWVAASAETVLLDDDFVLVAIGNAFHRLDRAAVATHVARHVIRGGCIALVWSWSPSQGERPWQRCLAEAIEHWTDRVDARGRVPDNWKRAIDDDPHEAVLRRAGFEWEGRREFPTIERWTVESLTGHVYSSSVLNRAALGPLTGEFENDIRARLLGCDPTGLFEQDQTYACDLARRPG